MDAVIRGNSLYTIVEGPTWEKAQDNALALGGNLATILDEEENLFVANSFSDSNLSGYTDGKVYDNPLFKSIEEDIYWIGLTKASGSWEWVTGESLSSNYQGWGPLAPFGDNGTLDRAAMITEGYDTTVAAPWVESAGNWDNNVSGGEFEWFGIAEIPLNLSITTSSTPTEGAGVFTTSINLSAGSKTSGNLAEGVQVFWRVRGISEEDLASGSLSGSGKIVNGKLDIQQSLISDADSGEIYELSIFSDVELTQQVGNTFSVAIADESGPITIRAKRSTTLNPGEDNLILKGTFSINGKGNNRKNLIVGNKANNFLDGKKGKDKLKGGRGEDILIGDRGGDILTGGGDSDVFKYRSIKDSGVKGGSRDVITDFQPFIDQINLSKIDAFKGQIGNQKFVYIGSNEFTGTQGEVRFESGFLSLNTDSDTVADSIIKLNGITAFTGDFLIL